MELEGLDRRAFLARSAGVAFALTPLPRRWLASGRAARSTDLQVGLDRDSTILVNGAPLFPFISWKADIADLPANVRLGINVFMGTSASDESAFAQAVGNAGAYYIAPYDPTRPADPPSTIGYYLEDEPDGHGFLPSALPQTQRVTATGKLVFETFTAHFWSKAADPPAGGKTLYPQYFANVDVAGTDVYPYAKFCGNATVTNASVFDVQRDLVQDAAGKPTFQWIEATALGGSCADPGNPQLTPARARAELWDAVAAGAKGLGIFTWANQGGIWQSFLVAPDIQDQIKAELARISSLSAALLSTPQPVRTRPNTPLRATARVYGGRTYVIAVNNSAAPLTTAFGVPAIAARSASVWGENRSVRVNRGGMSDRFDAYDVHVYVA